MKILLIDPPLARFTGFIRFYFPIGLAYVGAALENAGHEVLIYDVDAAEKGNSLDYSDEYNRLERYRQELNNNEHPVWREVAQILNKYNPDLVGITAMTTKFGSVLKTAAIVKKWNAKCLVIVGGPHPTLLPDQTLKSANIDIAVRDEGEQTFVEIVDLIEKNPPIWPSQLQNVLGISYKENNEIKHNQPRPYIEDLDQIAFPARHLLMHHENYSSEDMGVLMTSRGCPFNCSYCCHIWGQKVRNRSVNDIIKEIKFVKEKYNSTQIEFKDDSFTLNKKRTIELCDRIINEKLKINWGCSTRVNLLDEELIKKMKKSGCNVVKLGIETGSERILKETDKGITFAQMKQTAKLLNKHKIFWSGYFMMGLPTETEDDIRQTYQFMKEINPYYAGIGVYNPFPKTKLYDQGVAMGLLYNATKVEIEHFLKTNPKDYFFINPDKRVINIEQNKFSELAREMGKIFHEHNIQWKNLIRRGWTRRLTYVQNPRMLFSDIKKATNWVFN